MQRMEPGSVLSSEDAMNRLLALVILLAAWSCSGGNGQTLDTASDQAELSHDALHDAADDAADGASSTEVEAIADSATPPLPGAPCDDQDDCTFGETIQGDGACGGGLAYTCDDGRPCTVDSCDGKGKNVFALVEACLVDGVCAFHGEPAPGLQCAVCDVAESGTAWTYAGDGAACDDSNACTEGDACSTDGCGGSAVDCDDQNPCTIDSCLPDSGCQHDSAALEEHPCTLVDPCVAWAWCIGAECSAGDALDCDDDNPCTADTCDGAGGCQHDALDGLDCSDGDVCTIGDVCAADSCQPGPQSEDCNDGNECTNDLCHPVSGCYHELNDNPCCDVTGKNMCDDGNLCTIDSCNPETGECFYENALWKCNDYDPCTGSDHCQAGKCVGVPLACDDGNPCTVDSCVKKTGCLHSPLDAVPCDDGLECSTGDTCIVGACVADLSPCGCQPEFSPAVNKVSVLAVGADGKPGSGLDVDGNTATCSPKGQCSNGIDNALSFLAGFAGGALQKALDDGQVILLYEHREFAADGSPYPLACYIGSPADPACALQTQTCNYLVKQSSFSPDCTPLIAMDNAKVAGAKLSAGGPGYDFPLLLPLAEGAILDVTLYFAQISATVTFQAGTPAALQGILAGAVSKKGMIDAIDLVPPEQLPLDKETVKAMIDMMVTNDIDT
ncbi:MAG: hypothetical protein FJ109_20120, partial [Deltaproteobacteria bacterium]|nr:hypothetical protein [Deltaproteobacteria bacterium]